VVIIVVTKKSTFWDVTLWSHCLHRQGQKGSQVQTKWQHTIREDSTLQMHFAFIFKHFTVKFTSCIYRPSYEILHHLLTHCRHSNIILFWGTAFQHVSWYVPSFSCPNYMSSPSCLDFIYVCAELQPIACSGKQEKTGNMSCICNLYSAILGKGKERYPCNRPWRPTGLWDVKAPTFSRQSAHMAGFGFQPYLQEILGTHFC
jgi:hypothetical protein